MKLLAVVFALLAGCASDEGVTERAKRSLIRQTPVVESRPAASPNEAVSPNVADPKTIYFDFDKSDIRPDQRSVVAANAEWVRNHPSRRVRLEGHTDSRGEAEYNLALGMRRALSVQKYLIAMGVDRGQLAVVSYGEESPAGPGWDENRRVEFK